MLVIQCCDDNTIELETCCVGKENLFSMAKNKAERNGGPI